MQLPSRDDRFVELVVTIKNLASLNQRLLEELEPTADHLEQQIALAKAIALLSSDLLDLAELSHSRQEGQL